MKTYKVTLKHDTGTVRIKTSALDPESAILKVLDSESAPRSAVVRVDLVISECKPEDAIPHAKHVGMDHIERITSGLSTMLSNIEEGTLPDIDLNEKLREDDFFNNFQDVRLLSDSIKDMEERTKELAKLFEDLVKSIDQ